MNRFPSKTLLTLCAAVVLSATVPAARAEAPMCSAVAARDCAPWDDEAFSVYVQKPGSKPDPENPWIRISIWQAPAIAKPVTFHFPDETGKVGGVVFEGSAFPGVRGTVSFPRVEFGKELEGSFDFVTPKGRRVTGRFRATWRTQPALCG